MDDKRADIKNLLRISEGITGGAERLRTGAGSKPNGEADSYQDGETPRQSRFTSYRRSLKADL